jgi:hypothetical protein
MSTFDRCLTAPRPRRRLPHPPVQQAVNLTKLDTASLRRYRRVHQLVGGRARGGRTGAAWAAHGDRRALQAAAYGCMGPMRGAWA